MHCKSLSSVCSRQSSQIATHPTISGSALQHVVPGRTVTVAPTTYMPQAPQATKPVLVQTDRTNLLVHCLLRQRDKETRQKLDKKRHVVLLRAHL